MSLDLSPAGAAAPALTRVLAHARTEASLLVRNGEQLLLALVIPVALLLVGRFQGHRLELDLDAVVPSVLALALWSSGFTSLAISTGFERRYNVLERLAATPLGRSGILAGKALAISLVTCGQLALLMLVALLLGWRPHPDPGTVGVAVAAALLAMLAFASLALCLAGTLRAELTLALANLIYLAGLMLGLVLPPSAYPGWAAPALSALPTAALGEAFRSGAPWTLITLAVWALLATALARRVFRWTS